MRMTQTVAGFPDRRRIERLRRMGIAGAIVVAVLFAGLVIWFHQSGGTGTNTTHSRGGSSTGATAVASASPLATVTPSGPGAKQPPFDESLVKQVVAFEAAYWSTSYRQTATQRASTLARVVAADFDDELAPSSLGPNQAQAALVASQTVQTAQVLPSGIALAQSSINTATSRAIVTLRKTTAGGSTTLSSLVDISRWTRTSAGWRVTDHYIAEGGEGP